MYTVYVLRSLKNKRRYTGQTKDLESRLNQHNLGITKSTSRYGPFKLEYTESFNTRSEAMRRERFLKSGRGREWLDSNIK